MHYRREIDGLRAVAVLPVILFHAGFPYSSGGYVGVDVFFVISGYLITSILLKELDSESFSIVKFYERRARRIIPALFFVLLVTIPFAWAWMTPIQFRNYSQALVAITVLSSNILFWKKESYFSPAAEENPLLHTWSLAVEEQFYIFFPVLMLGIWRFGKSPAFYMVVIFSGISLFLSEWGWRQQPLANFYLLPTRAWEIGAGALCAFYLYGKEKNESNILSGLGLSLIIFSVVCFNDSVPFPSFYTLIPVAGAALIILYSGSGTYVGKFLSMRVLVSVGLISFSAYLWHQPLMAFARIQSNSPPGWEAMSLLVLISLILAYFTWRYVEKPFRRRSSLLTPRRIFNLTAVMSVALFSFGAYGHYQEGFPSRFNLSSLQERYLTSAVPSPYRKRCHASEANEIEPDKACNYHTADGSIAVLGDSHTVELAFALANNIENEGLGVKHYSFSGCKPSYLSGENTPCADWTTKVAKHIMENDEIKYVIVSYRMNLHLWGDHSGVYPDFPRDVTERDRKRVLSSLERMLSNISDSGKKVVFLGQSPELPFDIRSILYKDDGDKELVEGVARGWWNRRTEYFYNNFVPDERVAIIRNEDIFCNYEVCFAGEEGVSFYFDDDHLSVAGAELVADKVLASLGVGSSVN